MGRGRLFLSTLSMRLPGEGKKLGKNIEENKRSIKGPPI